MASIGNIAGLNGIQSLLGSGLGVGGVNPLEQLLSGLSGGCSGCGCKGGCCGGGCCGGGGCHGCASCAHSRGAGLIGGYGGY